MNTMTTRKPVSSAPRSWARHPGRARRPDWPVRV